MTNTVRLVLSLSLASITFVVGVGVVRAAEIVASLFSTPVHTEVPAQENIGVTSTENFRSLGSPDGEMTIARGLVLSCYDPSILPVWHELKKDENFKWWLDGTEGLLNCSDLIAIKNADLDRNGADEMLARGKGPRLCSATGNCGFWIFQKKGKMWRTILSGTDYSEYETLEEQVQRTSTRRYADILLKSHHTAAETGFRTYRFDGSRYVESRCVYEVPKFRREGEGSMELITCAEFDRRSDIDASASTGTDDK